MKEEAGIEKVRVQLKERQDNSYDLVIGTDLFEKIGKDLKASGWAERWVVISDSVVMKLHGNRLTEVLRDFRIKVERIGFPAGESSKSRRMKNYLEDTMLGLGLGRDSGVIACGGGVTGDLAGFTAATYLRGVPWIQVPTTLLAMVDASIGGKTAIDVPEGKNLIGAFHQPKAVYIDVSLLDTLPRRHLAAGMAEIIKHAVIRDRHFFELLEEKAEAALEGETKAQVPLIRRSCEIKAEVVSADEKEADYRRILNYGHTLGHALEAISRYTLLHGEAVSLGMALEANLAVFLGIMPPEEMERQNALLSRIGLPTKAAAGLRALLGRYVRPQDILEYTHFDKKSRGGVVEFVLPTRIGQIKRLKKRVGLPLDDRTLLSFLRRVLH